MAWTAYYQFLEGLLTLVNSIDFDTTGSNNLKIALCTSASGWSPTASTDDFFDDCTANEVSGSGYTAGGNAVEGQNVAETGGTFTVDATDPSAWAQDASGFNDAKFAILYKDSGSTATSPLIAYHTFSTVKGNVSGSLTVQFDASGIFTLA